MSANRGGLDSARRLVTRDPATLSDLGRSIQRATVNTLVEHMGAVEGFKHPRDCPECRSGKHQNCTEWAIDEDTDEVVACDCAEGGHL